MKKNLIALLALVMMVAALVGCGTENAAQGKQDATRTVTDVDGTAVEIPANVERVADLWHANNQVVLMLGGADKLVTTTKSVQSLAWFAKVYPRIKEISAPVKGTDVNWEEVEKEKPQVVLASNKGQIEMARKHNIPALRVSFTDYDGLHKTVRITADVLGGDAPNRAEKYISYLDEKTKFVDDRTKDIPDAERPVVLHIVGGDDLLKVDGTNTIIDEWIRYGGGKNAIAEKGSMINTTIEEILKADPDIIIIGGAQAQKGIEAIKNDPQWAGIKAVKNGRLYGSPVGTFNWARYSTEAALQVLWAGQTIQPKLFADVDLVKETVDFYKRFLHYDLSEADAQRIIKGEAPAK